MHKSTVDKILTSSSSNRLPHGLGDSRQECELCETAGLGDSRQECEFPSGSVDKLDDFMT